MRWLDIAGPPGVGKSTLCDERWPPRSIVWDQKGFPEDWGPFLVCVEKLMGKIRRHPSIGACCSMWGRSLKKMATVQRVKSREVYVQTGFAQRGLGIGWRLEQETRSSEAVAEFYRLMPVSLGVVILTADVEEVQRRNVERGKDRAFMVPPMQRSLQIAVDILSERGVPVTFIDTGENVDESRRRLRAFERRCLDLADTGASRHRGEVAVSAASD